MRWLGGIASASCELPGDAAVTTTSGDNEGRGVWRLQSELNNAPNGVDMSKDSVADRREDVGIATRQRQLGREPGLNLAAYASHIDRKGVSGMARLKGDA